MKPAQGIHPEFTLPKIWSGPENIIQYVREGRKSVLNIIPFSTLEQKGESFRSWAGNTHYIVDPSLLRIMFRDRVHEFQKSRSMIVLFEPTVPTSVIISHGKTWEEQHRIMGKVFNWRNIQAFDGPIRAICDEFFADGGLPEGSNVNVTPIMQNLTYAIIARLLVSKPNGSQMFRLVEAFDQVLERTMRMHTFDLALARMPFLPNPRRLLYAKIIAELSDSAQEILNWRAASPPPEQQDFLEVLFEAYDYRANPTKQNARHIRDNIATFLIAGHETTAMALAWGIYAASFLPKTQDKICKEAREANALGDLVRTEAFIQEALRLFPSAPALLRHAPKNENFGGFKLKKGETIIVPIISLHRHRDLWSNPDQFLPERFIGFSPAPFTYLPFGAGPRVCIGSALAMMEAKIIFSKLMERFRFSPGSEQPIAQSILTLRSQNGIKINVKRRRSSAKPPIRA